MLSYIASNSTADLIKSVCKELNITILNQEVEELDFLKYIKQTKVNFNIIKYLIIDLSQLKNTEDEVTNSIQYFKELYINTRIIVIARGYDSQNIILTKLYENKIYNIINANDEEQLMLELKRCLSQEGLQEKNVKRFKRIEEVKVNKIQMHKKLIQKIKEKVKSQLQSMKKEVDHKTQNKNDSDVYFVVTTIDAITKLIRLICYIIVFTLTSLGLTIIFNEELRNVVFKIFN